MIDRKGGTMNKVLLINRIDTKKFRDEEKRMFFLVDESKSQCVQEHLIDILDGTELIPKENIIYKYNGVEILMKEEDIPKIIKILMEANVNIYSIYQLYDPME